MISFSAENRFGSGVPTLAVDGHFALHAYPDQAKGFWRNKRVLEEQICFLPGGAFAAVTDRSMAIARAGTDDDMAKH